MRLFLAVCLTGTVLSLAACNSAENPSAGTATPAASSSAVVPAQMAVTPAQTTAAPVNQAIWLEPAALSTCAKHEKVIVNWDVRGIANVKAVELHPVKGDKEPMFAKGGRFGNKVTGPWMTAGSVMILRNQADGSELGRATVGSLPCTK